MNKDIMETWWAPTFFGIMMAAILISTFHDKHQIDWLAAMLLSLNIITCFCNVIDSIPHVSSQLPTSD